MNSFAPQPLHWQSLSLEQSALIEASAGTGKTHTLVQLVLRALLERGLRLNQLLLCTFTNAATSELSQRVRIRVHQLANWHADFQANSASPELASGDTELWHYLAERWRQSALHQADAVLIRLALGDIASFSAKTLHSFCAEVLQRFPVECQALAELTNVDENALLEQALNESILALSAGKLAPNAPDWQRTLKLNQSYIKKLRNSLQRALSYSPLAVQAMNLPNAPCAVPALDVLSQRNALIKSIDFALAHPALKLRIMAARTLSGMRAWLAQMAPSADADAANWGALFTAINDADLQSVFEKGAQKLKPNAPLPAPIVDCFSLLAWQAKMQIAHESALFMHLLSAVQARMQAILQSTQQTTFERMIQQVRHAIAPDASAAKLEHVRAAKLVNLLRAAYPLAFVDEFQDTNASQFAVLEAIYAPPKTPDIINRTSETLIVIGDPKQAIYRFRGGDVYNYLRTAKRLPRYVLSTNYRAQNGLIDALNAFYLPIATSAFAAKGIEFHSVQKANPHEASLPAVLTMLELDDASEAGSSDREVWSEHCLKACALHIQGLLQNGVSSKDIAVLLPRRSDVASALALLQSLGIAAQISARTEVITSDCAAALLRLLYCIETPADRRLQRATWLAAPFSWPAAALHSGAEQALARWFAPLPQRLAQQGILAICHALWQACAHLAPALRLRWQTDLRHLGELIAQNCSAQTDCSALIACFAALGEQNSGEIGADASAGKQRSAELNAVSLLTLHGAKGLEFPHVMLPLLWSARRNKSVEYPICAAEAGMQIDLGSANYDSAVQQEKDELLAELLRLQYVAITRASKNVWIAIAAPSMAAPSNNALHYTLDLLGLSKSELSQTFQSDSRGWRAGVQSLLGNASIALEKMDVQTNELNWQNARRTGIAQTHQPNADLTSKSTAEVQAIQYTARKAQRRLSYSAMARMSDAISLTQIGSELSRAMTDHEPDPALLALAPIRGRSFGLLAHALFENIWPCVPENWTERWHALLDAQIQTLARSDPDMAMLMAEPERKNALREMFERCANTPLRAEANSTCLASLLSEQRLIELEFHLPLPSLGLAALANVGPKHGLAPLLNLSALEQSAQIAGMLQGFIDLVFFDQGRYYVLDYKTNALGENLADYRQEAILREMGLHHYHLQHLLYQLALHRYLSSNLPGYQFEQHFGGAIYLFVRAFGRGEVRGEGLGVYEHRASAELLDELSEIFGSVHGHLAGAD